MTRIRESQGRTPRASDQRIREIIEFMANKQAENEKVSMVSVSKGKRNYSLSQDWDYKSFWLDEIDRLRFLRDSISDQGFLRDLIRFERAWLQAWIPTESLCYLWYRWDGRRGREEEVRWIWMKCLDESSMWRNLHKGIPERSTSGRRIDNVVF